MQCKSASDCPSPDQCKPSSSLGYNVCRKNDNNTLPDAGPPLKPDATPPKLDGAPPKLDSAPAKPDAPSPKKDTSGGDTQAPKVVISSPAASAVVPASTTIVVQATDDRSVTRVELKVDGTLLSSKTAAPYDFPVTLSPGTHQLEADAYDPANNRGVATVTVSVKVDVVPDPDGGGPAPDHGSGFTPGAFGAPCASSSDCASKRCVRDQAGGGKYCSQLCNQLYPCPEQAECLQAVDSSWVCALKTTSQGATSRSPAEGGCALAPLPAAGGLLALLVALAPLALLRRRR